MIARSRSGRAGSERLMPFAGSPNRLNIRLLTPTEVQRKKVVWVNARWNRGETFIALMRASARRKRQPKRAAKMDGAAKGPLRVTVISKYEDTSIRSNAGIPARHNHGERVMEVAALFVLSEEQFIRKNMARPIEKIPVAIYKTMELDALLVRK